MSIILGIDPGTLKTGYGIIHLLEGQLKVLDYGVIRPPSKLKLSDRYLIIYEGVESLIDQFEPQIMVLETQYVHKNPQSAIKLGMARGIAMIAAKKRKLQVFEYAPAKAKKAVVGKGRASKYQVQGMMQRLLNLKSAPEPEDAADALALAVCHAHAYHFGEQI
jgi:crossover junction endodeoxyribonuclease RuvC